MEFKPEKIGDKIASEILQCYNQRILLKHKACEITKSGYSRDKSMVYFYCGNEIGYITFDAQSFFREAQGLIAERSRENGNTINFKNQQRG